MEEISSCTSHVRKKVELSCKRKEGSLQKFLIGSISVNGSSSGHNFELSFPITRDEKDALALQISSSSILIPINPNCSLSDQKTFVSVDTSNILPSATKAFASCATESSLTILRNIKVRPHPLPGFECRSVWQHRPDPPAKQLSSFQLRPDLFWSAAFNREVVFNNG